MTGADQLRLVAGTLLDLEPVMDVMENSFDPAFGEAWTAPQCSGLLPMPGVWLTLARDGAEVVGFALARRVLNEAELLLLAVKRDWQGHGVGRMLLDGFIRTASRRGAKRVYLEVREGNRALNLYKAAGFSQVGRRANYYSGRDGQVYDALTLARNTDV
jgi:[ribosomal protein S18]-alanine N-acetyltransferase